MQVNSTCECPRSMADAGHSRASDSTGYREAGQRERERVRIALYVQGTHSRPFPPLQTRSLLGKSRNFKQTIRSQGVTTTTRNKIHAGSDQRRNRNKVVIVQFFPFLWTIMGKKMQGGSNAVF
jgi:hypothetical protein